MVDTRDMFTHTSLREEGVCISDKPPMSMLQL